MRDDLDSQFNSLRPARKVSRRDFVTTALGGALGTGFALVVQPIAAQTVIETSAEGLVAGTVEVPVADGAIRVYRAQPDASGKGAQHFPVILVVQEIFGVTAHIADLCRRLAKRGYLAIAPDLYARQGDPAPLATVPEIFDKIVSKVADAQVLSDLDATAKWAVANGGDIKRIGITGFCWGGRIVWLYVNHNPSIKAGVAWYGKLRGEVTANTPRHPLDIADNLHAPVLGLYGGQDQGIPLADVDAMNARLKAAGGKSYIHVYPDAPHAFNADYRPSYRADAAQDGWQRMLDWFGKNGI